MNKEEAFRQWINNTQGKGLTYQEMWSAACEWQKGEDIRLCNNLPEPSYAGLGYYQGVVDCYEAIRDQP